MQGGGGGSKSNIAEVHMCARVIQGLLAAGDLAVDQIGVITPYSEQVIESAGHCMRAQALATAGYSVAV